MANTRIPGTIIRSGSIPTTALGGGVVSSSVQVISSLPGDTVSSSAQVAALLPTNTVSSSGQVTAFLPTGTVSASSQYPGWVTSSTQVNYTQLQNIPNGIASSSAQVTALLPTDVVSSSAQVVTFLPTGTVSSSAQYPGWVTSSTQIDYGQLQNIPSGIASSSTQIKNYLPTDTVSSSTQVTTFLPTNTVSSSGQVTAFLPANTVSSSGQVTTFLPTGTVSSSGQVSYLGLSNIPAGIASSSTQVKTYLPTDTVSSSTQVTTFLPTGTISSSGQVSLSGISGTTFSNNDFSFPLNVTVNGLLTATSQSVIYITSSQLNVGSNDIILNTTEQLRFGGLTVFDSGSANQSGSLFWDSLNNVWLYVHAGTSNTSSILITGPENTGVLGSEQFLTQNRVPKAGVNGDHIVDSQISDNGTTVGITGNLSVTGSVSAGSYTGSLSGSSVVASTLTGTLQTAAQTNVTSVGTLTSLTVSGTASITGVSNYLSINTTGTPTAGTAALQISVNGTNSRTIRMTNTEATGRTYDLINGAAGVPGNFGLYDDTAGAYRLMLSASGNIGINTTTPTQKLSIEGSGATLAGVAAISLYDTNSNSSRRWAISNGAGGNATDLIGKLVFSVGTGTATANAINGSAAMVINSAGEVGINQTSPSAPLEVRVNRTSSTNGTVLVLSDNVVGAQTDGVYKALRATSNNGNSVSEIRFLESDGTNNNTAIAFATAPTAGGLTERMRIDPSGNVGIGTTTVTSKLSILGGSLTSTGNYALSIATALTTGRAGTYDAGSVAAIHTYYDNSSVELSAGSSAGYVSAISVTGNNAGNFIGTVRLITSGSERMRINASGNVGIKTTSPTRELDVNGNSIIRGFQTIYGTGTAGTLFLHNTAAEWALQVNNTTNSFQIVNWGTTQTLFTVSGSGNVGIGTTNPTTTLHVYGSDGGFRVFGTTRSQVLLESSAGLWQIETPTAAGNVPAGSLGIVQGGVGTRLTISGSGNVGIGTTNPGQKLVVNGNISLVSGSSFVSLDGAGAGSPPSGLGYGMFAYASIGLGIYSGHTSIAFITNNPTTNEEAMRIVSGKVGIGTTGPDALLHIRTATNANFILEQSSTGANYTTLKSNGSARGYIGIENSSGTGIFGSNDAYGMAIGTSGATAVKISTNNAIRLQISSVGNVIVGTDGNVGGSNQHFQVGAYAIYFNDVGTKSAGSTYNICTLESPSAGKIKVHSTHNNGSNYIEYSFAYSSSGKQLSLVHQNQAYSPGAITLSLNTSTGVVSTNSLPYDTNIQVVVETIRGSITFS